MRKQRTQAEIVAKKIADIISDVRLDLDQVGIYLARNHENVSFRRLDIIANSAEYEKRNKELQDDTNTLF